ncbi:3'-5' exoribonuclease [Chlorogloeopsis fritschii PCC 6912]|uniref:3'-5' exoribonuclease n=1 Tax=Chlorogloeopsis fritschii PCC 6912 TaxID=211165 RepID=A0A433N1Q3_CHLFR|nr:3'-5' exoribonuclease [Chlorogloeopsis fritschii]RUR74914.1 3'-5' exoribonuclease [Chlorogloeopsis fritschii PCC 6912]
MLKRYFFDTEFNDTGTLIDLISIGAVCEDGREYYAVSRDFNPNNCNPWVQQNVLPLLPPTDYNFTWYNPSGAIYTTPLWKPRSAIASELVDFFGVNQGIAPELWANNSAYDWVSLCQLYGPMVALPEGMPHHCNDIRQLKEELGRPPIPNQEDTKHDALNDARYNLRVWQYLMSTKNQPSLFGTGVAP